MAKQREASYRAELAFPTTHFTGYPTGARKLPVLWKVWPRVKISGGSDELKIPLHNVGLGAARDVSLTWWSFPIEPTVRASQRVGTASVDSRIFNIRGWRTLIDIRYRWKRNVDVEEPATCFD